jgi:predicted PP-loop superfamily ATPase
MTKSATALQRITKFVKDNKISEMKQWLKRRIYLKDHLMRYTRQLIKEIRKILAFLSGIQSKCSNVIKVIVLKFFKLINLYLSDVLNKNEREILTLQSIKMH